MTPEPDKWTTGMRIVIVAFVAFWGWVIWQALPYFFIRNEIITHDTGGPLYPEVIDSNIKSLRGQTAVIDGVCASACLANLPRACVTPRAMLGFHSPRGGTESQLQQARKTLANHMPPAMSAWFMSGPAYSQRAIWLDAGEAVKLGAKECK